MHAPLTTLLDRLERPEMHGMDIIPWGAPVPSFGNPTVAAVATLGINPSNREFVDDEGCELDGADRRFHTLQSLGLRSWVDADARHLALILQSCRDYFLRNPYDRWFKRLDQIVAGTGASYYDDKAPACHLDLIPYATSIKWTSLTFKQRSYLLSAVGDVLGVLLRDSAIKVLLLNGSAVVDQFQRVSGVVLQAHEMADWNLPRQAVSDVSGFGYVGNVNSLCGVPLGREVLVLGYNHNIQSSFGVTSAVIAAISVWVKSRARKALQ